LVNLLTENQDENSPTFELATKIKNISQGLQILRPRDVIREASTLDEAIETAKEGIIKDLPPFEQLLGKVKQDYQNLGAIPDSNNGNHDEQQDLINMLNMIDWYYQKDKIVQSICLAREWLVSLVCYQLNLAFPSIDIDSLNSDQRDEVEILLAGGKIGDRQSIYLEQWKELDKKLTKKFKDIWANVFLLAKLRNDVLHAGFRQNYRSAAEIEEQFLPIIEELKRLAKSVNLIPPNPPLLIQENPFS
jgi:lysophospholipase L1-like esterase